MSRINTESKIIDIINKFERNQVNVNTDELNQNEKLNLLKNNDSSKTLYGENEITEKSSKKLSENCDNKKDNLKQISQDLLINKCNIQSKNVTLTEIESISQSEIIPQTEIECQSENVLQTESNLQTEINLQPEIKSNTKSEITLQTKEKCDSQSVTIIANEDKNSKEENIQESKIQLQQENSLFNIESEPKQYESNNNEEIITNKEADNNDTNKIIEKGIDKEIIIENDTVEIMKNVQQENTQPDLENKEIQYESNSTVEVKINNEETDDNETGKTSEKEVENDTEMTIQKEFNPKLEDSSSQIELNNKTSEKTEESLINDDINKESIEILTTCNKENSFINEDKMLGQEKDEKLNIKENNLSCLEKDESQNDKVISIKDETEKKKHTPNYKELKASITEIFSEYKNEKLEEHELLNKEENIKEKNNNVKSDIQKSINDEKLEILKSGNSSHLLKNVSDLKSFSIKDGDSKLKKKNKKNIDNSSISNQNLNTVSVLGINNLKNKTIERRPMIKNQVRNIKSTVGVNDGNESQKPYKEKIIDERYKLTHVLTRGGCGEIRETEDIITGEKVYKFFTF